jgi:hypothetical protein
MIMKKGFIFGAVLSVVGGCGLIDSHRFSGEYSFDPQHFTSPKWADENPSSTVPSVPCNASTEGLCDFASLFPAGSGLQAACDMSSNLCAAVAEIRLSEMVNLSKQTSFPKEAVQFGIDAVAIRRVKYWVTSNTFNFSTPRLEIYVAPQAAQDEHDQRARLLGVIGPLSAGSSSCSDPIDKNGEPLAEGARVCDMPLESAGEAALADFAKHYGTPFQFIAHATITAKAGDPVPSGSVDFFLRPTVGLSIFE